jgi:hypothetical protein
VGIAVNAREDGFPASTVPDVVQIDEDRDGPQRLAVIAV